jgi:iron complex outermembrane receptor protein
MLLLLQASVQAQVQPAATGAAAAAEGAAQVLITGTRRINRTIAESESPVDVLSASDLQASGATELATVLGQLLPSFNFPRPSATDTTDAIRPAQLRGLSPDQTLVLVDGKRRHTTAIVNVNGSQGRGSSPADLNSIPLVAVERIEVLRDGAAAQYGSDAIAGVINIVLKKGGAGGSLGLDYAQAGEGDGKRVTASASAGLALSDLGWVRVGLELRDQGYTNRAGADLRDPTEPRFGRVNQRLGDPDSKQNALVLNGQFNLGGLEAYALATLSQRHTTAAAFWRPSQTAVGSGSLRSTLYPEGWLPLEDSRSTDTGVVAGLRGDVAGWRWDVSVNHGRNRFELDVTNSVNLSLGATSPTSFDAGTLSNQQTVFNADVARDIDAGLHAPLTVALGAEARRERYTIGAGELSSYTGSGAQGFSGFRPVNAGNSSRHSQALYLNLETAFSKAWSAAAAVRAEDYSDFGNATALKLSTRYAFGPAAALRATASTGFRAPSLAQQHYTITTTNFAVVNGVSTPLETGTFAVGSAAAQALGAVPLKAEKARNLSLGALLRPLPQWQTTVDVYQIDIDQRVLLSVNLVLPTAVRDVLAAQGVLAQSGRYFTNAVDTRTRGVDIVSTWQQDWQGAGRTDFTLAYNHNKNSVTHVSANPALLTANNLTLIDRQTIGRATVASPRDKLALAAEHTLGAWTLRAAATRYGSFTVPQNNATLDQNYGAKWVADVSAGWRSGAFSASVGVENLADTYPDETTSAGNLNTNGIFRYSGFSPFGFNGRQFYTKAGYRW